MTGAGFRHTFRHPSDIGSGGFRHHFRCQKHVGTKRANFQGNSASDIPSDIPSDCSDIAPPTVPLRGTYPPARMREGRAADALRLVGMAA